MRINPISANILRAAQFAQVLPLAEEHKGNVTAISFHSEGKWLVTGSEDGTIKVWDLRSVSITVMSRLLSYHILQWKRTGQHIRNYEVGAPGELDGPELKYHSSSYRPDRSERRVHSSESRGIIFLRPGRQH